MENINPKTIKFASKAFGKRHIIEIQLFLDAAVNRHDFRIHWEHGFNQKLADASQFCETVSEALEYANQLKDRLSEKTISASAFDRVEQIKPPQPGDSPRPSAGPAFKDKKPAPPKNLKEPPK